MLDKLKWDVGLKPAQAADRCPRPALFGWGDEVGRWGKNLILIGVGVG